jgi:hypothetical protein
VSPLEAATTRRGVKDVLPGRAVLEPAVGLNAAPDHKGRIVVEVRHSAVPLSRCIDRHPSIKVTVLPLQDVQGNHRGLGAHPRTFARKPFGRAFPAPAATTSSVMRGRETQPRHFDGRLKHDVPRGIIPVRRAL